MPRAVGCFRKAGFTVLPYPVDYVTAGKVTPNDDLQLSRELRRLDLAAHEWIGLVGYRVLGWTDELFPGPEPGHAAAPANVDNLTSRDSRR
jgi:hypothetical protein